MNLSEMPAPIFVVSQDALHDLVETLSSEKLLAIDTESNSMYVYRSRVCLIQVSTRDHDYIIDPLAIENMQPFGELMKNPDIEKVFHGAEYDLICLKRDFNFQLVNLFDTMLTARLLRLEVQGLADLLYVYFQIDMDKTQRLSDWGKRPLTIEMVHYARLDTHYLPALRDRMYEQLVECDALAEAYEIFGDAIRVEPPDREFDPEGFWKIGHPYRLKRREMAILRELYLLREDIAREQDKPPNQMIGNKTLVAISQQRPTNLRELDKVRGLGSRYRDYYADDILEAVEVAMTKTPGKPPPRPKRDRVFIKRYNALHAWRKKQADKRDLDSSIVLTKTTMRELAREFPLTLEALAQIEGIGEWRLQHYGKSLLKVMHKLE